MLRSASASAIWNQYMRNATKGMPVEGFTPPQPIVAGKPVLDGDKLAGSVVAIDKITGKLATDFTPPAAREERTYHDIHDILHYVNKDDPRGPAPANPADDPMYRPWEDAVARWADANGIVVQKPPTEYDDVHRPEYQPSVSWVSPMGNATFTERTVTLEANASAPRGVARVEFAVDGQILGRVSYLPYRLTVTLPGTLERGFHNFTATAYDDILDSASASVTVNVAVEPAGPAARWTSPAEGSALPLFPVPLAVAVYGGDAELVNFYVQPEGGEAQLLGGIAPMGGQAAATWTNKPAPGKYHLWAEVVRGGTAETGERISVLVQ
jgi:hypothetical protein